MADPIDAVEISPLRQYPLIVVDILDMGLRGLKTLTALEVGTMAESVQAAIDYRYEAEEEFKTTPYKLLYKNGVVTFPVTAVEFRIRLKFKNQDDADVSYITVRWKASDKRTVRGTYATSDKAVS